MISYILSESISDNSIEEPKAPPAYFHSSFVVVPLTSNTTPLAKTISLAASESTLPTSRSLPP